jgi:hypothetical protein
MKNVLDPFIPTLGLLIGVNGRVHACVPVCLPICLSACVSSVAYLAHPANHQNKPSSEMSLDAMYGVDKLRGPRLPLLQVPTTAGTGSEVTPISIVTTGEQEKVCTHSFVRC